MEEEHDTDDEDIEAQIRRELEGLQPNKDKRRQFEPMQMEMPCGKLTIMDYVVFSLSQKKNAISLIASALATVDWC